MCRRATLLALIAVLALAAASCRREARRAAAPAPPPTPGAAEERLTKADVDMFLEVRAKALTRIEEELDLAEKRPRSTLQHVVEMSTAEQDAVGALGFDWERYRWVRDEVARLLAAQRQREDSALLVVELTRARDDLIAQMKLAKDPASRQFLEAQASALTGQLARLASSRRAEAVDTESARLVNQARAELAVQQGRQDRIQRRVRDLLQRERAGGKPAAAPTPSRETARKAR